MKVVLFCGGMGTRISDYSENIPKPMVPVGHHPIIWHVMQYYSGYGHQDFILTLGHKANVIKDFFLSHKPETFADCVISGFGSDVELLNEPQKDWRVTLIDTGIWRNVSQRLLAVRDHVINEEMFLVNYSDGLTDIDLNVMIERFKQSGKVACFLATRPPITFHLADIDQDGEVKAIRVSDKSDMWINGGYFIMRPEIFDYMDESDQELVIEPFTRLIAEDKLMAYKHEGFWRCMDTLKDRQVLQEMIERGDMPWHRHLASENRPKLSVAT